MEAETKVQGENGHREAASAVYGLLVQLQVICREKLDAAAEEARRMGKSVGWVLRQRYYVPHPCIANALHAFYNCPFLEYDESLAPSRDMARGVDQDFLKADPWVPLRIREDTVHVLTDDPESVAKRVWIQKLFPGKKIKFYVGLREDVLRYIDSMYGSRAASAASQ